jgi:F420-dependent methylenetetrahydromethanopterin dehydrogenase
VLVVLVIIGIITAMAVVSTGVLGGDHQMDEEAQRLQATNPDVVLFFSAPAPAANFAKAARELLDWDVPFIASGGRRNFTPPLAGPGGGKSS